MVFVIKANGEKQKFDSKKIIGTCLRAGVSQREAERIASEISATVKDGDRTRDVLKQILRKLDALQSGHAEKYSFRQALSELDPEYNEFEKYVSHLLNAHGYTTKWNQIIQGAIIEHQVDVVAEKDGKKILVECKHHRNPHRMTGLGIPLTYWAVLDDIQKGKNYYDNMWLVTNTKFSMHAIKYAKAKGLLLTGWGQPKENDLPSLAHEKKLYPVTVLGLPENEVVQISRAGFLLLNELFVTDEREIRKRTGFSKKKVNDILNKTKRVIG
jgi:hypothetical protein